MQVEPENTNQGIPFILDATENQVIPSLPCERFRLTFHVTSLMVLPPYKGGIFRGAFGNAFRRSVCAIRGTDCAECMLRGQCLYVSLFEPPPPPGFADAAKFHHAPAPYVLNPPLDNRQSYKPGETLFFELILMGRAIDALPYFVYSLIEMGRLGLGRERGRYELTRVDLLRSNEEFQVYDGKTQILQAYPAGGQTPTDMTPEKVKSLSIHFLTPLRLKEKGSLVTQLTFPLFFERLAQRIELLSTFYGTQNTLSALPELHQKAQKIRTTSDELHWYDWERYSARQKNLMKLGGLRGKIHFKGDLTPFMPYLRIGEMVNAGQGTSFGLGRFCITIQSKMISSNIGSRCR